MKKIFLGINECKPGMKMAETIFNDYGAAIVAENTILDIHVINKISRLGINKIKVYDDSNDNIVVSGTELFRAQYSENVDIMKSVLHDISTGKDLDIKKVNDVSSSIITRINENRDIVSCISQMRSADEYTYTHSINVSFLCMLIGKWLKYDYEKVNELVKAGLLHDIGKSMIPLEILNKPGTLTNEEYSEMKKHTKYGYQIASKISGLNDGILNGILMHHEREDGKGYPLNLKSDQIHEFGKILAVADIYDAMTSNRVYREKESPFDVFEMMENHAFGVLDHRVTNAFLKNISSYYIGDFVKINTGNIGEIVYINPMHISQPIIRVDNQYVDLAADKKIKILELI